MTRSSLWFVCFCALVVPACSDESGPGAGGSGAGGVAGAAAGGAGGISSGGGAGKGVLDSGPLLPLLNAEPRDLTTDHDGASVRISIWYGNGPTPPEDLSQAVSLHTHPADTVVTAAVSAEKPDAGWIGGAWVVHPAAVLLPGWYAVVLAPGAGALNGGRKRADGGYESRFRVGSDPLLVGVGACASSDVAEFPKVRLDFSEAVALPAGPPPIQVVANDQPVSCELYDPPSDLSPSMGLACTPPIPASAPLSITVGSGIVALSSGLPLRTSASVLPRTFEIPPPAAYDSCRYWRETEVPPS